MTKKDERGTFMKNLKDFFYDKNDILIALAILVIAALLIVWRMDVIMDYPKTLAEETGTIDTTEPEAVDGEEPAEPAGSLWTGGALSRDVTVTVQGGSATAAVQSLIDADLFESYAQYEKTCDDAGYKPENIKATTFTFPAGSTRTDIARMVTE